MALIHWDDSEGFMEKSAGRVALISPEEVVVVVPVDMAMVARGLAAGGMTVIGLTGVRIYVGMLGVIKGVTATSRGFSGFWSGMISLEFQPSWEHCW